MRAQSKMKLNHFVGAVEDAKLIKGTDLAIIISLEVAIRSGSAASGKLNNVKDFI